MLRKFTPIVLAVVLLITSLTAKSQYYYYDNRYYDKDVIWEIGASGGLMLGITDIGANKGFFPNLKGGIRTNGSIYAGALYQNVAGARLEVTFGSISGADSNGLHKQRNLSFRTPIREIAVIGELHPFNLTYSENPMPFSPYIALGLGWFSFDPQANLNGRWVSLQPLRTEGQGFPERPGTRPYRLSQSNIIIGGGARFELSQLISARIEMLFRNTYTDYLDDASTLYADPAWFDMYLSPQSANLAKQLHDRSVIKDPGYSGPNAIRAGSKTKDYYMTFNFKLGINLGRSRTEY